jgi:hypothetical protein
MNFIPSYVEPFMKGALIPVQEIQNAIIPLFFDMISCEYHNAISIVPNGNVQFDKFTVPRELITTLDDQVINESAGDSLFRNAFERIFKEKFDAHINLRKNIDFVKKFVDLFDLLMEYRQLKRDSSDELKTYYLNELLTFYNNLERYDLYLKYVEILCKIHMNASNLVGAAYAIKLHAQLLDWTDEKLEPYLKHPLYPSINIHKQLKETLFLDIIHNFTNGEAWEKVVLKI